MWYNESIINVKNILIKIENIQQEYKSHIIKKSKQVKKEQIKKNKICYFIDKKWIWKLK